MSNAYSFSETLSTAWALLLTKLFFRRARLVRRPVYIRGRKSLEYGEGFTTGHGCRFDLEGKKKTLFIGRELRMGDYCHIAAYERVSIGDDVLIASKVFISDTSHGEYGAGAQSPDVPPRERALVSAPVVIGDRVWLGDNVAVLSGVTIGSGCIIGANSVVTRDVPENCIAAGVPARVIKRWNGVSWESVDK